MHQDSSVPEVSDRVVGFPYGTEAAPYCGKGTFAHGIDFQSAEVQPRYSGLVEREFRKLRSVADERVANGTKCARRRGLRTLSYRTI